jgi:membrane protein implicated in regulation of membrane protease activity
VTGQHVIHHLAGTCTSTSGSPAWLAILIAAILLTAAIAGPVFTAIWLLRRAGRAAAEPTAADPAALLPA